MEYVLRETIETTNGTFNIIEVGESVFWQVNYPNQSNGMLFHSLNAAQDYIRDTEVTASWEDLFQDYVSRNLATN